jgi:hypothetical protein
MKKILKISALICAISLVAIGCKKEEKPPSIIGVWGFEKGEFKDVTFSNQINPITQAMVRLFINEIMAMSDSNISISLLDVETLELCKDGKAIIVGEESSEEGTYTTTGKILTITRKIPVPPTTGYDFIEQTLSGIYNVSKKNLFWDVDVDVSGVFGNMADWDDLDEWVQEYIKEGIREQFGELADFIIANLGEIFTGMKGITGAIYGFTFVRQ